MWPVWFVPWWRLLRLSLSGAEGLNTGGDDDDHALDQQLNVGVDVVQRKDVVEDAEQNRAGDGPGNGPDPAHQTGAPDDDGGDGVQLVANSVVRTALIELAGVDDAGQSGEQAGDREHCDLDPARVDARETGRALVAAEGVDVAGEDRVADHEDRDDTDGEEDQCGDRHGAVERT